MPITISFTQELNKSLQIGDTAYHSVINDSSTGGFDVSTSYVEIGTVTAMSPFNGSVATITCDTTSSNEPAAVGDFIFFSKNPVVNLGKLKGYFAKAKFQTTDFAEIDIVTGELLDTEDQRQRKELYCVSSEMFVSSK